MFWTHPWRMIIVNSYVCNQPYDMATCIAMFTNISATTFFISNDFDLCYDRAEQ